MRLFVSVDLDPALAEDVARVQNRFADARGLNLTDPEQAHVTMKFLGDTDPDRVPAILRALEAAVGAADVSPFEAEFGGLGVFPSLAYITVVWLGVRDGNDELARLHEAIEPRIVELGFEPEEHDFTPHVTLARMQHAGGKELVQDVVRSEEPTVGRMTVTEIRLTRSTLTNDGPVYETVDSVLLPD